MRDLKFRIWDIDHKIMVHSAIELKKDSILQRAKLEERTSDNVIWLQFTGFKDQKGVEIYDGDLLKAFGMIYQVVFSDGAFYMKLRSVHHRLSRVFITHEEIEVVGNIHENPELLK